MMNNEDSSGQILDEAGITFLHDDSAETGGCSTESTSPTYVKTNMTSEFFNLDMNETLSTAENARHGAITVSELNDETRSILESEKGWPSWLYMRAEAVNFLYEKMNLEKCVESSLEKAESISKLESRYYELQAKLESAELQRVTDQAEIDRLNSQVQII